MESEDGAIAAFIAPIVTVMVVCMLWYLLNFSLFMAFQINSVFLGITLKVLYNNKNDNNVSTNKDTAK